MNDKDDQQKNAADQERETALPTSDKRISSRRVVGLTLAAVVGVLVIAGGLTAGAISYHNKSDEVSRLRKQHSATELELKSLKNRLAIAERKASSEFFRGYKAANKSLESEGFTYLDGLKAGHRDVFNGFTGWVDGQWYLVEIGHHEYGHEITTRVDVTRCELVYIDANDQTYSRGYAC